jgi:hypothetical protein
MVYTKVIQEHGSTSVVALCTDQFVAIILDHAGVINILNTVVRSLFTVRVLNVSSVLGDNELKSQ